MSVTIQEFTYKYPIQMIGTEAGVLWLRYNKCRKE